MKERLDILLVKKGYAPSRSRAKDMILEGSVYVNGNRAEKAGEFREETTDIIEIRESRLKYVSRGGLKLEKAAERWQPDLKGRICMDIGASTGGFTDCMLQRGAARVYSVDVGHGQLAERLRRDSRVVCMEDTNFRYLKKGDIPEEPDFAGADVSFISLTKILIPARNLLKTGGEMVCLIKPQFEAGKEGVGKRGVVREAGIHRRVISGIVDYADCIGFDVLGLDYSPIRGPEGNIEYLLYLKKPAEPEEAVRNLSEKEAEETAERITGQRAGLSGSDFWRPAIHRLVQTAWEELKAETSS